jgi:uncharacterized membrane protein YeaQ/YmgE (transglycosylase-associated protein family)
MKTAKPSTQTATENESCKAMVSLLTLLLDWSRSGMFYSIWLLAAALAGWVSGKLAGDNGFGTGADILLGITGAFVVRWSLEKIGISLQDAYLLLFSIWGVQPHSLPLWSLALDATIGQRLDPDSKAISAILLRIQLP